MKRLITAGFIAFILPLTSFAQVNWTRHTVDSFFEGGWEVCTSDIDRDGDVDILGAGWEANDIAWWENDGNQSFTKHIVDSSFDGARSVYAIDIDEDGDVDLLGVASGANTLAMWLNNGSETFTKSNISTTYNGAWHVYAIDLDSDFDIDIVTASIQDKITWWENNGSENFTQHDISTSFGSARVAYAIDMDHDGDNDVLGAAWDADDINWWENDGSENFTEHTIDGNFDGTTDVYATDMDEDGDIDVLGTAYTGGDIAWWENNGSEVFTKHNISTGYSSPTCAFPVDVDGDGDMDVVVTGSGGGMGSVEWFQNDGSQNFTEKTIEPGVTGIHWIYPMDIDNDGDIDVAGTSAYAGDKVYWWESDLNPAVGISMIPNDLPIVVPAGGCFRFTGILTNNTNQTQQVDVWLKVRLPGGLLYGPIERFNNVWLSPYQSLAIRNVRQDIPGFAPYGSYDYVAYCGNYPGTVMHQANFRFGVVPSAEVSGFNDWSLSGGWFKEQMPSDLPKEYALATIYPNPFNACTTIKYELPNAGQVNLDVYNIAGRKVAVLAEGFHSAGVHSVSWNASSYSSGVYFCKLKTGGDVFTQKMILMK